MKIKLLAIGKTDHKKLQAFIEEYIARLKHYVPFEIVIIPDIKKAKYLSEAQQKQIEGEEIIKLILPQDRVILLDEKGKTFSSIGFSEFLQKEMNSGLKQLVFVIGGPYGFSKAIYQRSNVMVSLSAMTFSHQMIRLFFIEQLYRAFTILRNEPYHHT